MNRTLVNCYRPVVEFKFLASNSVVMVGNIIANMLIILILIKTKQWPITLVNLFFGLSVSDLHSALCLTGKIAGDQEDEN